MGEVGLCAPTGLMSGPAGGCGRWSIVGDVRMVGHTGPHPPLSPCTRALFAFRLAFCFIRVNGRRRTCDGRRATDNGQWATGDDQMDRRRRTACLHVAMMSVSASTYTWCGGSSVDRWRGRSCNPRPVVCMMRLLGVRATRAPCPAWSMVSTRFGLVHVSRGLNGGSSLGERAFFLREVSSSPSKARISDGPGWLQDTLTIRVGMCSNLRRPVHDGIWAH